MLRHPRGKSCPKGNLIKITLRNLEKKTKQSNTTSASDVTQAITVKKKAVANEIPNDNPFNPSIRLKEWVTPVVANIVNNTAKGASKKS